MFDRTSLKKLIHDYRAYYDLRHQLKAPADKARAAAKHAIVIMRQDDFIGGMKLLKEAEVTIRDARRDMRAHPALSDEGYFREMLEEYVEAKAYYHFLTGTKFTIPSFVPLSTTEALGGICDFTGELVRKAMSIADDAHVKELDAYIQVTQSIMDELSRVSFSGKMREKYDNVERNLMRLERIRYEVKGREIV